MNTSFNENLTELLKTDSRFVDDEGELIKAAVIDRAWKIDHELVKLLLSDSAIKEKFFDEIEGHWIFNNNIFIEYISEKKFLANSYTRFRNRIGLNIDGKYISERGEVSLVWPYKDCVLEGGQTKEEEKRKEIFFNEILAQDEIDRLFDPKALTNWKRYTPDGEQKVAEIKRDEDGTIRENMIIKGNNLVALHSLKTQFRGKVKLIYIDPPYNTGNDSFGYNDNFNHSSWLTFMRNRLEVAKMLLETNGVIVIHCDDNEQAYLKVLCDGIFKPENFINNITVKSSTPSGRKTTHRESNIIKLKDYLLVYKNNGCLKINSQYTKRKTWDTHFSRILNMNTLEYNNLIDILIENELLPFESKIENVDITNKKIKDFYLEHKNDIFQTQPSISDDGRRMSLEKPDQVIKYSDNPVQYALNGRRLVFLKESINTLDSGEEDLAILLCDFWDDIDFQNTQNEGGISFPAGKKPEALLRRLIYLFTNEGELVLDFFNGSGTTSSVALKLKRKFIGVEQLDYGENDSVNRLLKSIKGDKSGISESVNWQGGGDFIYCELKKFNEAFMDKIQAAKTSEEIINLWKDIAENSFLNYYVNPEMPEQAAKDFIELGKTENGLEKQKELFCELLNKNQLYVNLSEIDDEQFAVSDEDKKLNKLFYGDD